MIYRINPCMWIACLIFACGNHESLLNFPCWGLLLLREDICQPEERFKGIAHPEMENHSDPSHHWRAGWGVFDMLNPHSSCDSDLLPALKMTVVLCYLTFQHISRHPRPAPERPSFLFLSQNRELSRDSTRLPSRLWTPSLVSDILKMVAKQWFVFGVLVERTTEAGSTPESTLTGQKQWFNHKWWLWMCL